MIHRIPGRWLSVIIAVAVVGALVIYAGSSRSQAAPPNGLLADPAAEQSVAQPVTVLSAADAVGLLIKVGIVAVLLAGSLWLLRRYGGATSRSSGRTGVVQVADTILLSNGRAVYVLDLGERAIVVGATPQQFSPLAEITDADSLSRLRATPSRQQPHLRGLGQRLGTAMQGWSTPAARPDHDDSPPLTEWRAATDTFEEVVVPLHQPPTPQATALLRRIHPLPNPIPLLERLGQGMPRPEAEPPLADEKVRTIRGRVQGARRSG